jgi:hypothetical protein
MNKGRKLNPKAGFAPISIEKYVELHLKSNPEDQRKDIVTRLKSSLRDHQNGVKCTCGNPIWVIGSAVVWNACFTCITGEAHPDEDYEIDQALEPDGKPGQDTRAKT